MRREKEIRILSRNQLSHDTDLPRKKIRKDGREEDVKEIPYDPYYLDSRLFDKHLQREDKLGPERFPLKTEGKVVKGRIWTVNA